MYVIAIMIVAMPETPNKKTHQFTRYYNYGIQSYLDNSLTLLTSIIL